MDWDGRQCGRKSQCHDASQASAMNTTVTRCTYIMKCLQPFKISFSQGPFVVSVLVYLPYTAIYVSLITPFATSSNGPLQPTALQRYYVANVANVFWEIDSLLLHLTPKAIADIAPPSLSAHESLLTKILYNCNIRNPP